MTLCVVVVVSRYHGYQWFLAVQFVNQLAVCPGGLSVIRFACWVHLASAAPYLENHVIRLLLAPLLKAVVAQMRTLLCGHTVRLSLRGLYGLRAFQAGMGP